METSKQVQTGGDAIVKVLAEYGIECLFTSPIAALAPLWESLAKNYKENENAIPRYYNCRHEVIAVSLAIGYYKSTGKMAAVCLPTGLGVTNGSMAIRMARQEKVPMLILSPDTLTFGEDNMKDPGPEWATFLIDDHGPAAHSALTTKWNIACRTNLDLYPNLHRAIYFANQIPRGPVLVEVPFDIMMSSFDGIDNRSPTPITSDATQASDAHLLSIATIIGSAKYPIIITESFGKNKKAISTLTACAETIGAPIFEWWMPCYANVDRSHALHSIAPVESIIAEADVIIVAASNGPWHSPATPLNTEAKVIVIDEDPMRPRSAYWGYTTTHCVSGDPVINLEKIVENIKANSAGLASAAAQRTEHSAGLASAAAQRTEHWAKRNKEEKIKFEEIAALESDKAAKEGKIHASTFFTALSRTLPPGSIIVDEIVAQVPCYTHFLFQNPSKNFQHVRGWQGGLGTGIGVGLGAKVGNPDKVVVCIIGDGAFNYNPIPAAFGFSQQYNLPILVCIMNNSGYISQTWNFYRYFPNGAALTSNNTLGNVISPTPKYSLLASVWGGNGYEVSRQDGLEDILTEALSKSDGVSLLDVAVTP